MGTLKIFYRSSRDNVLKIIDIIKLKKKTIIMKLKLQDVDNKIMKTTIRFCKEITKKLAVLIWK
jgi:hypothetical protein